VRQGMSGWSLDPWPFRISTLTVRCETIRLPVDTRWSDEEVMRVSGGENPRLDGAHL
jgi:hypothetical protein